METEVVNHTRDRTDSGLGIKVLVEGISPIIDIIAIHGLDGHREDSWTAENGILWLKDLLPQRLPHARIATYGYDAFTGSQSNQIDETLYGHAKNFIVRLALLRNRSTTTTRPIIFLAHSWGGIILKFALIHANQCNKSHLLHHRQIMLSTIGILFFGTAHQGAAVALSASQILVLSPVVGNTTRTLLRNLATNSEMLEIQLSQFNAISNFFITKFLYESYQTVLHDGTSSFIVAKSSAIVPGARDAEAIALNKKHMDMIKFSSDEDDDFNVVVSLLQDIEHAERSLVDANGSTSHIKILQDHFQPGASSLVAAKGGLGACDNIEMTYLQPLKIFDSVIKEIGDVCVCCHFREKNKVMFFRLGPSIRQARLGNALRCF
ncbi:hypothetical protein BU17DRAFT_45782 [Hysterangium stoloniferum]|nr:hypothetical protein BU17DRAFT_45782 [Hysterangium stoloniferum]